MYIKYICIKEKNIFISKKYFRCFGQPYIYIIMKVCKCHVNPVGYIDRDRL